MGKQALDLSKLTLEERLELLEELLESLRRAPKLLSHSDAIRVEVDRKLDALFEEGPLGATWETVEALRSDAGRPLPPLPKIKPL